MSCSLLNTNQAAAYLGVSKSFLEKDRWRGATIPFVKVGRRTIKYRPADLDQFIEEHLRYSTSEVQPCVS